VYLHVGWVLLPCALTRFSLSLSAAKAASEAAKQTALRFDEMRRQQEIEEEALFQRQQALLSKKPGVFVCLCVCVCVCLVVVLICMGVCVCVCVAALH
jgi:hypothetical protein